MVPYAVIDGCLVDFRVMILVIAWRMTTPAFSVSFFESPVVMQTLIAGCMPQSAS